MMLQRRLTQAIARRALLRRPSQVTSARRTPIAPAGLPRSSFRTFSSTPEPTARPKTTFIQTLLEAFDDKERLMQWDEDGLFDPDMPQSKKVMMFLFFHRYFDPPPFDLRDFLDGAQVALDLVFHTMYSPDFMIAATNTDEDRTFKTEKLLESIMTRSCVDAIKKEFKAYHDDGYTDVELTKFDIHECSLHDVTISKDHKLLYVDVLYRTTEHLAMAKTNAVTTTEVRTSHCQLRFQTAMDNLDNPDWTIARVFDH
ncbi:hypothetical protein H310_01747 [Aphanomyces invadans]|uniref:Tim44-like domain-containing protein n=1 Tax=Aphanomyces invadans TaxID=157072 RepID=A0A024ULP7_9STRA|nr:hypothetical protein H310_01747 [Aphanomyces invadans]ETW07105.1 hypothetical protein H310_01747 [Aphanomyces invadans]|eukprot:XP_008863198.1 hypothetical protein H310_01747 [Aphanomyces invadans]